MGNSSQCWPPRGPGNLNRPRSHFGGPPRFQNHSRLPATGGHSAPGFHGNSDVNNQGRNTGMGNGFNSQAPNNTMFTPNMFPAQTRGRFPPPQSNSVPDFSRPPPAFMNTAPGVQGNTIIPDGTMNGQQNPANTFTLQAQNLQGFGQQAQMNSGYQNYGMITNQQTGMNMNNIANQSSMQGPQAQSGFQTATSTCGLSNFGSNSNQSLQMNEQRNRFWNINQNQQQMPGANFPPSSTGTGLVPHQGMSGPPLFSPATAQTPGFGQPQFVNGQALPAGPHMSRGPAGVGQAPVMNNAYLFNTGVPGNSGPFRNNAPSFTGPSMPQGNVVDQRYIQNNGQN